MICSSCLQIAALSQEMTHPESFYRKRRKKGSSRQLWRKAKAQKAGKLIVFLMRKTHPGNSLKCGKIVSRTLEDRDNFVSALNVG
jgi:hypothetical protein